MENQTYVSKISYLGSLESSTENGSPSLNLDRLRIFNQNNIFKIYLVLFGKFFNLN